MAIILTASLGVHPAGINELLMPDNVPSRLRRLLPRGPVTTKSKWTNKVHRRRRDEGGGAALLSAVRRFARLSWVPTIGELGAAPFTWARTEC